MVYYEELSEDELAERRERERLEKLEQLAALTDADLEEYGSDRSDLAIETTEEPVRGGREIVDKTDIVTIEQDRSIDIDKKGNLVLTYGDVEGITPDPVYRADRTIFKVNYVVEKIPAPKTNRILGLTVFPKNKITKGSVGEIEITEDRVDGIIRYQDYPTSFVKSIGESISLKPVGDVGASYTLVAKDITNSKFYDWENNKFDNGYFEKQGYIGDGACNLVIPAQSGENKYELFFKNTGSTAYEQSYSGSNTSIPTESEPWKIFQMPQATTTIKFQEESSFITGETTTVTRDPLTTLKDINSISKGEVDVSITILAKRGKLQLVDHEDIINENVSIDMKAFSVKEARKDHPLISDTNLKIKVSSDQSTATISGTITFEQFSLRDSTVEIEPSNFLKIIK